MTHDIVIDTLFDENVLGALKVLGTGRLVMDRDRDGHEEPYLTPEDGFLIVRIKDRDPFLFVRELERRVSAMRVVKVINRTPGGSDEGDQAPPVAGSFAAQRASGLL